MGKSKVRHEAISEHTHGEANSHWETKFLPTAPPPNGALPRGELIRPEEGHSGRCFKKIRPNPWEGNNVLKSSKGSKIWVRKIGRKPGIVQKTGGDKLNTAEGGDNYGG